MAKRKLDYNGVTIEEVKSYYCYGKAFGSLEEAIDYVDFTVTNKESPVLDRFDRGYLAGYYDNQIDHMLKVEGLIHANNY